MSINKTAIRQSFIFQLSFMLLLCFAVQVHAQDLLTCDFTGMDPALNAPWTNVSFLAPGIGFSGWDLGPGAHPETGINDAFGFYINASSPESTLGEGIADGEYLTFTLDPQSGVLDLNGKKIRFNECLGTLDPYGSGRARVLAPVLPPTLIGTEVFYAYCPNKPFDFASNPVRVMIVE